MKTGIFFLLIPLLWVGTADISRAADEAVPAPVESTEPAIKNITFSAEQARLAGIVVKPLVPRIQTRQIYAPGEILANGYTSSLVSPRVDSVVVRRNAGLGDRVKKGQPLVTLFSETVAEAQAAFRVADSEWRRVKKLGRKSIGEKRYVLAQTTYESAYGRLLAYGLSKEAIKNIGSSRQHLGEYTLDAIRDGAILSDNFRQGQRVGAGEPLMEIADERELWVEARLAPGTRRAIPAGTRAEVRIGRESFPARVIRKTHTIDKVTRTRLVRLLVNNEAHRLHPGMYADVYFIFSTDKEIMAVPETALLRGSDGDWQVFIEEDPGKYRARKVTLGPSFGGLREITGVEPGSRVVLKGAFFIASEQAKSGFDPHDH